MIICNSSFEVLAFPENAIDKIANSARVCYKSESKGEKSNDNLVKKLIQLEHFTPLEHCYATVKIITDRGVMAELTRHRLASFNIESTRYCNYSKKGMTFIKPSFFNEGTVPYLEWLHAMEDAEMYYKCLLSIGATPEQARSVLPNSLKTEIIMTCNFREFIHIFKLRCSEKAHPQIREIMIPLREEFKKRCPVIFG